MSAIVMTPLVRRMFSERVGTASSSGCLPWTGSVASHGYGVMSWREAGGKFREYAHRLAAMLVYPNLPPKTAVRQTCGNRLCMAAAHLAIGTQADVVRASVQRLAARTTLAEIFHASYIPEPNSGCWLWTASVSPTGYGRLSHGGRPYYAHRLSLELDGRVLAEGMFACHHCDNPSCVNPAHLFAGTSSDNQRDALAKGRRSRAPIVFGEAHHKAKLNREQVLEIRRCAREGQTYSDLGRRYGLTKSSIRYIAIRRNWKSVPDAVAS